MPNNDESTFARRLKKARQDAHLSGTAVADLTGIKYQTYMSYEKDSRAVMPSVENLIKISDVLQVSADYLLKGDRREIPRQKNFAGSYVIDGQRFSVVDDENKAESENEKKDIAPMVEKIKNIVLTNDKVFYDGKELDSDARALIYRDLGSLEVHAMLKTDNEKLNDIVNIAKVLVKTPDAREAMNSTGIERFKKLLEVMENKLSPTTKEAQNDDSDK